MPGFDGTGPRRSGPMTGGGSGFCVLRVPNRPGEPLIGAAGRTGWPVGMTVEGGAELAPLRRQARRIEAVLCVIRAWIAHLEANRRQANVGG
jgi:hypothetical protein